MVHKISQSLWCARKWLDAIGNDDFDGHDLTKAQTNDTEMVKKVCKQRCEDQQEQLMSTFSAYPNKQNFPYRQDFCLVMKKVVKVCKNQKRSEAFANRYAREHS